MSRRRVTVAIVVALSLAHRAAAEPLVHLQTPSAVQTDGGSTLRLPPGYFLEEPMWRDLDAEQRRLQEAETRLKAENASLRKQAAAWQPGWYTLGTVLLVGVAAGYYVHDKL